MGPKSILNQFKSSKLEAPLSRRAEHRYRVEPEGDARSEGTLGSQEAAQGRLAALDIDLEDKKKCTWPAIQSHQGRAYRVVNSWEHAKGGLQKPTAVEGLLPGAKGGKYALRLSRPSSLTLGHPRAGKPLFPSCNGARGKSRPEVPPERRASSCPRFQGASCRRPGEAPRAWLSPAKAPSGVTVVISQMSTQGRLPIKTKRERRKRTLRLGRE